MAARERPINIISIADGNPKVKGLSVGPPVGKLFRQIFPKKVQLVVAQMPHQLPFHIKNLGLLRIRQNYVQDFVNKDLNQFCLVRAHALHLGNVYLE